MLSIKFSPAVYGGKWKISFLTSSYEIIGQCFPVKMKFTVVNMKLNVRKNPQFWPNLCDSMIWTHESHSERCYCHPGLCNKLVAVYAARYPIMISCSLSSTLSSVKLILQDVNRQEQNRTCKQFFSETPGPTIVCKDGSRILRKGVCAKFFILQIHAPMRNFTARIFLLLSFLVFIEFEILPILSFFSLLFVPILFLNIF